MPKNELEKKINKWAEKQIRNRVNTAKEMIDNGTRLAGRCIAKDIRTIFGQYIRKYYEYNPKRYKRQWYLETTLANVTVLRSGNVKICFSNESYNYVNPKTNPDMVFHTFMSSSRRQRPEVEAQDPHNFGVHVISFEPQNLEYFEDSFGQNIYFDTLLNKIQEKASEKYESFILKYISLRQN